MAEYTVTKQSHGMSVGQILRTTGLVNGYSQHECIVVGRFVERGYQHTKEGQIVWIHEDTLKELTA